jgi:hypothetical protein
VALATAPGVSAYAAVTIPALEDLHRAIAAQCSGAVRQKMRQDEELVRRMLAHWVSEVDEPPCLLLDRSGDIIGLGPDDPADEMARVFVPAGNVTV